MSIISTIGRKSLKVRALIWSIYLVLTLGALTMIYPFWLMISGTGKSMTDVSELDLIPSYLINDSAYYRKTVASLFNENIILAQSLYKYSITDFKTMELPTDLKETHLQKPRGFSYFPGSLFLLHTSSWGHFLSRPPPSNPCLACSAFRVIQTNLV